MLATVILKLVDDPVLDLADSFACQTNPFPGFFEGLSLAVLNPLSMPEHTALTRCQLAQERFARLSRYRGGE